MTEKIDKAALLAKLRAGASSRTPLRVECEGALAWIEELAGALREMEASTRLEDDWCPVCIEHPGRTGHADNCRMTTALGPLLEEKRDD